MTPDNQTMDSQAMDNTINQTMETSKASIDERIVTLTKELESLEPQCQQIEMFLDCLNSKREALNALKILSNNFEKIYDTKESEE